jgi:hypothetical protein
MLPRDPGRTLAGAYLARRGYMLGARERTFIEACIRSVHSFFDVLRSDPGEGTRLRDILLGTEHEVAERSSSMTLRPGRIVYARVVPFDGIALMVGAGSVVLGVNTRGKVLDLRKLLKASHGELTPALLASLEEQLRELYLDERELALNPPPPVLTNTDGDPIEYHELHYEIADPERAFQALRTLEAGVSESDLRKSGTVGRDGRIRKIDLSWLKRGNRMTSGWERTVLGGISIHGRRLRVVVNSAKRSRKIRSEIERRPGDEACYLKTEARSLESAMRKHRRRRRSPEALERDREERDRLLEHPEVIAELKRLPEASCEDWPDHPLPALGGKTPREAIEDPEGREMVEALLVDFEQAEGRHPEPLRFDFTTLRRRLGLLPRQE